MSVQFTTLANLMSRFQDQQAFPRELNTRTCNLIHPLGDGIFLYTAALREPFDPPASPVATARVGALRTGLNATMTGHLASLPGVLGH